MSEPTIWDLDVHRARSRIREGTTVLDLGASTGAFSWPARLAGADVFAVEPLPENAAALRSMGVPTVCAAVGGQNGYCALVEAMGEARATGSYVEAMSVAPTTVLLSLQTVLDLFGVADVDVMKVDVEGSEYATLLGASDETLQRVGYMAVEFHLWTAGDEPRRDGIGHRGRGARMAPGRGPAELFERLCCTHYVEVEGTFETGGTMYARRLR